MASVYQSEPETATAVQVVPLPTWVKVSVPSAGAQAELAPRRCRRSPKGCRRSGASVYP